MKKANFVLDVMVDEDGLLHATKVDMSEYSWMGHLLSMSEDDYIMKAKLVNGPDELNEGVVQDYVADMLCQVESFREQLEEQAGRAFTDSEWDNVERLIINGMAETDYENQDVDVTMVVWSVEVDLSVTFLVTYAP